MNKCERNLNQIITILKNAFEYVIGKMADRWDLAIAPNRLIGGVVRSLLSAI